MVKVDTKDRVEDGMGMDGKERQEADIQVDGKEGEQEDMQVGRRKEAIMEAHIKEDILEDIRVAAERELEVVAKERMVLRRLDTGWMSQAMTITTMNTIGRVSILWKMA